MGFQLLSRMRQQVPRPGDSAEVARHVCVGGCLLADGHNETHRFFCHESSGSWRLRFPSRGISPTLTEPRASLPVSFAASELAARAPPRLDAVRKHKRPRNLRSRSREPIVQHPIKVTALLSSRTLAKSSYFKESRTPSANPPLVLRDDTLARRGGPEGIRTLS